MIHPDQNFADFQKKLNELLLEHGISHFFMSFMYFDTEGNVTAPFLFNSDGLEAAQHGITQQRLVAAISEQSVGHVIDLLMKYNGLDMAAAKGAAKEMVKAQAHEKGIELHKQRLHRAAAGSIEA